MDLDTGSSSPMAKLVSVLHEVIDELVACDRTEPADAEVVPVLQELERAVRRLPVVRAGLVAELAERGIAADRQVRSTRDLLRTTLRISPQLASAYEAEAEDLIGTRVLSTGEELPPARAHVAAAVTEGAIGHEHTRLVVRTLDDLPAAVGRERLESAEADLVMHARTLAPDQLAKVCQRLRECIDPDGTLDDERQAERKRGFQLGRRTRDGLTPGHGMFTDEAVALLGAALEPLAAPAHTDLERDERTAAQRTHDALAELARTALARGDLPTQAGLPATLLITARVEDLERGSGWARTATDGRLPIATVLANLAETKMVGIAFTATGQPLWCGRETRLATAAQRYTTAAMDRGCVIPGCDVPLLRCQSHHIDEFAAGGRTDVDNLAWLCRYHHGRIAGWKLARRDGRVWCTPPRHLDPDQVPRVNSTFHPDDFFPTLSDECQDVSRPADRPVSASVS